MSRSREKFLYGLGVSAMLALGGAALLAAESTPTVEQRLERLERILRNQSLSDMLLQLQRLQREVQQLRGELEVQAHAMDSLQKRQRDLYLDIDRRLGELQPQPGGAPPPTPRSGPASAPPAVAQAPSGPPATAPAASTSSDPTREAADYQAAFELLQQGRYSESITAFQQFLDRYPGGSYSDNAQYWLGEASYVNRDFATAQKDFKTVLEKYPASAKVPGALLKLAYIHYEQKEWTQARKLLNQLIQEYATSTEARLAEKRLERMRLEGH